MSNPWEGSLPSANDSQSGNSNILNRIRLAINNSDYFKTADKLKLLIDDPTKFIEGRKWTSAEKEKLKQAEKDYAHIQSEKTNINNSLNEIEEFFNDKSKYSIKLSEDNINIDSRLKKIDDHLRQYEEIFKLLNEKRIGMTEEEKIWELKAQEQIKKLMSEKNSLNALIEEVVMLQNNLKQEEESIEQELNSLLKRGGSSRGQSCGSQSAEAINLQMAEIKNNTFNLRDKIKNICEKTGSLFGAVFDAIKNFSSKISEQLKSSALTLDESSELINGCPVALRQMRL